MIQALIGPLTELAGGWLKGKADKQAAEAKLKLTEAEAKAKIMLSKETSVADWERIMAQGSQLPHSSGQEQTRLVCSQR
jgi:hypothetical protein